MSSATIRLEFPADDIAVLTFDDPVRRVNVLSREVLDAFAQTLDTLAARGDDVPLSGLIIRESPAVFSPGPTSSSWPVA